MWSDIARYAPRFSTAVLTGTDRSGYPASVRCRPRLDHEARELVVAVVDAPTLLKGPAGLLFHRHDERLIRLYSFLVRGRLDRDGELWRLAPSAFVPGQGIGGMRSYVRLLRQGRSNARRHLQREGVEAPEVPWDEYRELLRRAKAP